MDEFIDGGYHVSLVLLLHTRMATNACIFVGLSSLSGPSLCSAEPSLEKCTVCLKSLGHNASLETWCNTKLLD